MSGNILNNRILLSKKFILLISLILFLSINNISCLNYNRGPLEENHPTNSNENNIDDDDEFTGNTYIEPTEEPSEHNDDSLLELDNDISDDSYDQGDDDDDDEDIEDEDINVDLDGKQGSGDYLDRLIDSSLLEMESESMDSSTYGLGEGEELDDTGKINSKYLNDNKLKEYLKKIGALDKMRNAKNKGKEALSSMKSKISSIPDSYRRMKGKIHPEKGVYDADGSNSNSENKVDHRRRLLNTMNDVDERRRERNRNDYGTHSNSNGENKVDHRRRLLNTMNDVDERRKNRETSRIGEIKRRFRRN